RNDRGGHGMKVKDIMSTDPVCCTRDTMLRDVAQLMCDNDCGEIPVIENATTRKVIGIVTDRDITCRTVALGKNPLELRAKDCMSEPAITVAQEARLDECTGLMELKQIRRIPVVDRSGACLGIVSQADLSRHA